MGPGDPPKLQIFGHLVSDGLHAKSVVPLQQFRPSILTVKGREEHYAASNDGFTMSSLPICPSAADGSTHASSNHTYPRIRIAKSHSGEAISNGPIRSQASRPPVPLRAEKRQTTKKSRRGPIWWHEPNTIQRTPKPDIPFPDTDPISQSIRRPTPQR